MHKRGLCHQVVSIWVSVTFEISVEMSKYILKVFSPSGSHTIVVFPHQTLYQYSEGQLVTYLHGSICTSNWRFLPPPQIRGTLKIIPASTTPTFKYATLRLHSHSLTSRPSSMRVGDSRRPLRYLFFSIVLDLVTSPLAECIRSRSTLQCCVSTVFSVCLNAVTLP